MTCTPVPTSTTLIADGGTTAFVYTFSLLGDFSTVTVQTALPGTEIYITIDESLYALDRINSTVTFDDAPEAGTKVRMSRCTDRSRLVNYTGGSTVLAEENLDADADQIFSILQELEEGTIESIVTGGVITDISLPLVFQFVGDGTTTDFELDGVRGIARAQALVTVENVLQPPTSSPVYYSILNEDDSEYPTSGDGDDILQFDVPPESGAAIIVTVLRGLVVGELGSGSIETDELADDAVTLDKINVGSGLDTRFLVIDTAGDPVARQITPADIVDAGVLSAPLFDAIVNAATGVSLSDLLKAPVAAVSFNNQRATNVGTPSAATDAANKAYVDGVAASPQVNVATGTIAQSALRTAGSSVTVSPGFAADIVIFVYPTAAETGSLTDAKAAPLVAITRNNTRRIVGRLRLTDGGGATDFLLGIQRSGSDVTFMVEDPNLGVPALISANCYWYAFKLS